MSNDNEIFNNQDINVNIFIKLSKKLINYIIKRPYLIILGMILGILLNFILIIFCFKKIINLSVNLNNNIQNNTQEIMKKEATDKKN